ncbi:hypothetical protein ACS0TY_000477 [Phlomoides rotata]
MYCVLNSFRRITTLKYYIQTGLDTLEGSRKTLLDRLLEIDQTTENPKEEDIERVRYCKKCNSNLDGPACTHCGLDEIFQVYEARLFRLNKSNNGEVITSVEEAINLQKKQSALNQFYWNLSREDKSATLPASDDTDTGTMHSLPPPWAFLDPQGNAYVLHFHTLGMQFLLLLFYVHWELWQIKIL